MEKRPLVSVIVIFLNEERFLAEAIESVFAQTYENWELLLCDDGSTDGGATIARKYAERFPQKVKYLHHTGHENRGMSATRNLGLRRARGEFVAWLDGDDVWIAAKLERQVELLIGHPAAAMVYGPVYVWYSWRGNGDGVPRDYIQDIGSDSDKMIQPPHLLVEFLRDEARTPGGALVRRTVLESVGGFEESFQTLHEDRVVHAKICLQWPVFASGECWYKYRQHSESSSYRASAALTERAAMSAYLEWLTGYLRALHNDDRTVWADVESLNRSLRGPLGWRSGERLLAGARCVLRGARIIADRILPGRVRSWVGLLVFGRKYCPPSGWLHFGNLRRVTPISKVFGWDRGLPTDRYYIEKFLETHRSDIQGRVLEVGDRAYTLKFGGDRVTKSDVLHARDGNPESTLVGDLCTGEGVPKNAFDCIILTQVLPFLYDFKGALANAVHSLKAGGVILVTVPGISQISRYDAARWGDFWRFTSTSARRLFEEHFAPEDLAVEVYGNVLAATAFLHGVAAGELRAAELDYRDPDYEMIVAVRAVRAQDGLGESRGS